MPVRPGLLADLAEWRWQAAQQLQRSLVIAADLEILRSRCAEDEDTWGRLLFLALEHLVWADEQKPIQELVKRCRREVENLRPPDRRWDTQLDRMEFLAELATSWSRLRDSPLLDRLALLIPDSATRPFAEVRWRSWWCSRNTSSGPRNRPSTSSAGFSATCPRC